MNWQDAFKFPIKGDRYGSYINDSNGQMIGNFLFGGDEAQKKLIDIINDNYPSSHEAKASYKEGKIFWGDQAIILIRGWGYLTGIGGLNLPAEEAATIQDNMAAFIVNQLNK